MVSGSRMAAPEHDARACGETVGPVNIFFAQTLDDFRGRRPRSPTPRARTREGGLGEGERPLHGPSMVTVTSLGLTAVDQSRVGARRRQPREQLAAREQPRTSPPESR